jgi:hypothetical protein
MLFSCVQILIVSKSEKLDFFSRSQFQTRTGHCSRSQFRIWKAILPSHHDMFLRSHAFTQGLLSIFEFGHPNMKVNVQSIYPFSHLDVQMKKKSNSQVVVMLVRHYVSWFSTVLSTGCFLSCFCTSCSYRSTCHCH